MAYAYFADGGQPRTKKALYDAVHRGEIVKVRENTPDGQIPVVSGDCVVEGPHYPEPHKWYAGVTLCNGNVVDVR